MEDGFPLFDPNDEAARQEQRLREYYEEFSANARKRLLAKTVVRPTSVYDVLYPQTREALTSKNVPINTNLEEDAKIIRDRLIAKIVTEETDLEKISEDFRKSLLARAKIQDDRNKLLRTAEAYRENNLAKNLAKDSDLEKDSEFIRRNNVAKNKPNPSLRGDIESNSESYKESALSKNTPKDQDLLRDSEAFRKGDIHKNVSNKSDIEEDSESFRKSNLSKNSTRPKTLDEIADAQRASMLSKNRKTDSDIEEDSDTYRRDDLAKNPPKDQDLLRDSESIRNQFRKNDLAKNVPNPSDIERDNNAFRRNNLSKNSDSRITTDVEADSTVVREDSIAKNTPNKSSLEDDSVVYRTDDLSKNKPSISDLEQDSIVYRTDDLAKNKPSESDLESDSVRFRADDLSNNKPNGSDLEKDSEPFRTDDLSKNKPSTSDLEEDSGQFRADDLSYNKPSESSLEVDSEQFREDDLSLNKPNSSNLEEDSEQFRADDLSYNKPKATNLETDSEPFRADDLSYNKPIETDLEVDSAPFREDDLSFNKPKDSDLETDSVPFRDDDLSFNKPNDSDLETDSVPFRDDDLSFNTPIETDLIVDSTPFLYNNLSANVPSDSDLETDSVPFRDDDLSANVLSTSDLATDSVPFREDDLSANVLSSSNLEVDSIPYRATDLAANVPINSNIASDSTQFRDDSLAKNVPYNTDLLLDSEITRKTAISKNEGFGLLGVTVQGAGTSSFLGISRVFTQGILVRQLLLSKNKPSEQNLLEDGYHFRVNNLHKNLWIPQASQVGASLEYGSSNTHFELLLATREATGGYAVRGGFDENGPATKRGVDAQALWLNDYNFNLQSIYGNFEKTSDEPFRSVDLTFDDKPYSVDKTAPQGGRFDTPVNSATATYFYGQGYVTENIRSYNLERNSFNIKNLQVGGLDGFNNLTNGFAGGDFDDLVASTIGSFNVRQSISTQVGTNSTPASVIIANGGRYFPGDGDLLRPEVDAQIGTAESMMAKTAIGNPYEDTDFFTGRRGVKHIVNTIKSSDQKLAANFDPQNNRAYIVGTNRDGSPRVSRQRFTIANPYAPGQAGKLLFSIKNYASGDQFFFPPYIQSIQNTENANWNSVNFLGRPEAVYTYNNSSRDASITFFVLTDYTESVDIGRDWGSEDMEKVTANFSNHFTDSDNAQNDARKLEQEKLRELKKKQEESISELNDKQNQLSLEQATNKEADPEVDVDNSGSWFDTVFNTKKKEAQKEKNEAAIAKSTALSDAIDERKKNLQEEAAKTIESIGEASETLNRATNYSESNNTAGNIYNLNITKKEFNGDEIICKPEDTINRIDTMKAGLMFQPAFFSGDKVDFTRKVEFLSKLTRPSAAPEQPNTGFSFTKPPVCHIRLGDWWNHDIIVNSVSFDYADSPWTLEGGRVQPMWVSVSINFNIIGPYGAATGRPPLAGDKGGMYSPV